LNTIIFSFEMDGEGTVRRRGARENRAQPKRPLSPEQTYNTSAVDTSRMGAVSPPDATGDSKTAKKGTQQQTQVREHESNTIVTMDIQDRPVSGEEEAVCWVCYEGGKV
jgi:hypothetical protein